MQAKILLVAVMLLSFSMARANGTEPGGGKKNEVNGTVIHADNKKPLKNVNVTAILLAKKEIAIKTDDLGSFAFDELQPGTYKFVFEKSGFKKVTKEKIVVKTDEAFLLNIEMIENKDFEIIPSPFQF